MALQIDFAGVGLPDESERIASLEAAKSRIAHEIGCVDRFIEKHGAKACSQQHESPSRKTLARVRDAHVRRRTLMDKLYAVQKSIVNHSRAPDDKSSSLSVRIACLDFMQCMSHARAHLMRCVQDWCHYQPMPGLPAADQHLFAVCVFAAAPVQITLSTRRGVCLFTDHSSVSDHLFGVDPYLARVSAFATTDVVVDHSRRKFDGRASSATSFNIPFDCVPAQALVPLCRLVSALCHDSKGNVRRSAFSSRIVDGVSGETTLSQFKFNEYLDENAAPLRAQLVLLYVANMIITSARRATADTIHDVVRKLLCAMDTALTHLHLLRRERAVDSEKPVRVLLERARRINRNSQSLAALVDCVRRRVCYDALDSMAQRYHDNCLEDVLSILCRVL